MQLVIFWIEISIIFGLIKLQTANNSTLETKHFFCGVKLSNAISKFCTAVNGPLTNHGGSSRSKRQSIVTECCQEPCSLKYLTKHYCAEINSEAMEKHQENLLNIIGYQYFINSRNNEIERSNENLINMKQRRQQQVRKSKSNRSSGSYRGGRNKMRLLAIGSGGGHNSFNISSHQHLVNLSLDVGNGKKARGKRNCRCKKQKNKKFKSKLTPEALNLILKSPPPQPARIGQIEDSQKPFYVVPH